MTRDAADGFEVMVGVSDPPAGEDAAPSRRCADEVARTTPGNHVNIRDDPMLRETPNRPHWRDQPWLDGAGRKVLPPCEPPDLTVIFQRPPHCDRAFVAAMPESATPAACAPPAASRW